jgi:hypothetical protein
VIHIEHAIAPEDRKMPEQKEEWITIAHGQDNLISDWSHGFAPVMDQINRYVNAIDREQLDLDWEEICDRVPYLKAKPWNISKGRAWRDYLNNLEHTMGCTLLEEECDGEHSVTLKLRASQKQPFLNTMRQLQISLAKYWEEHQLPQPYIVVGNGDDRVENWYKGFDIIDEIADCIESAWDKKIELDWPLIFGQIEGLQDLVGFKPEGQRDLLEILEMLGDVYVSWQGWDAGAPGLSGCWCEVGIRQGDVEKVWTMLNELLKHLRNILAQVD